MEKYCRAGQATYDNVTHAHCMLNTKSYKYTFKIVMFITFPLQQLLLERASMLRYTYTAGLVYNLVCSFNSHTSYSHRK